MRIVIALGGNALLRRGEEMSAANQRENVQIVAKQIAKIYEGNELVIAHGNGAKLACSHYKEHPTKKSKPTH